MKLSAISLATCILFSVTRFANTQWENYQPTHRMQGAGMQQHYNLGAMRNGMHPGSVIGKNILSPNKPMKYKDFVTIENTPSRVKSNYTLKIKYQCTRPLIIILFMDGNFLQLRETKMNKTIPLYMDSDVIFFRKFWSCERSLTESNVRVPLKFPRELLQRPDILLHKVWTMKDVNLKVAMIDKGLWNHLTKSKNLLRDIYHIAFEKAQRSMLVPLKVEHPYCRSEKASERCFTWPLQLYDTILQKNPPKSFPDEVVVSLINHPIVSSQTQYGLPRNFLPFKNPEMRLLNPSRHPRYTLSFMMFVASKCEKLCAIFQHIDDEDQYDSPSIFINEKGQLHVQAKVANNSSYGLLTEWTVPIREWIRLDIQQFSAVVNVTMRHGKNFTETKSMVNRYHMPVNLDYAAGFFTVGSSLFALTFHGIIGSATIWRNVLMTSDEIKLPPPDHEMFSLGIENLLNESDQLRKTINRRWGYLESQSSDKTDKTKLDICLPYFVEIIQPPKKEITDQCPLDSQPLPRRYKHIESQLIRCSNKKKKRSNLMAELGDRLGKKAKRLLGDADRITHMGTVIEILENASTLMHGPSLFLLYVIYANGFGTNIDVDKARKCLHSGALVGDKMCIKTLGYKYIIGEDGFPADGDIAIYYYFSAAHSSQMDRQMHVEEMTEVNRVRLTDERMMKQQTAEDEDLFYWFKHRAGTGMQEAKRNLGQLLYWGKQGLKRNLKAAFEYYEQAAQDTDDPNALYDYGLTLMKGQGTKADPEKAMGVMEKAAKYGSAAAVNAMGWHYIRQEGMKEKAVEYFEKANDLDNVDAAYNLGHMHHLGDYPGQKRDMKKAFQLYYKAATRGHIESSNRIAYIFSCGIRDFLYRNVKSACLFAKSVAELSPVMGEIVREALQAFRSQSWTKSTLLYLAAAESGFEIAGYNTAFLIEEDKTNQIRKNIQRDCVWRFWNLSANAYIPAPYALNRMGDYHYYGIRETTDLDEAISFYVKAARMNDPQAFFNLACILEEHGDLVGNDTLKLIGLPEASLQQKEDKILELYQMCSNIGSDENSMPCYMGLVRMKAIIIWKYSSLLTKVAATICAIGASTLLIFATSLLRHQRQTDSVVLTEEGSVENAENGPRTHLLQEEVVVHETLLEAIHSEKGKLRNHSCDTNNSDIENDLSMNDDSTHEQVKIGVSGKAMLEESSEEDEQIHENGLVSVVRRELSVPVDDITYPNEAEEEEEDEETGEIKLSV